MTDLPTPLVPLDVDLREFPFTPMFRSRLFGSEFHANATDAEWRAGVTLWLKSWDQVPAGTLPTDDVSLCRLAELGRDMRTWRKVRERALHGWRQCSDGRLHHAVVAEGVLEAWGKRRSASGRGKAGASARWSKSNASALAEPLAKPSNSNGTSNAQAMLADSKGERREETVPFSKEENGRKAASENGSANAKASAKPDPWKAVYDRGKEVLGRDSGGQITKLRKLLDDKPTKVMAKIEDAAEQRKPAEWLAAFLWSCNDNGKLSGEYVGGIPP